MASQELKDYINQQIKLGVPREAIKSALLAAGWSEKDVDEVLAGFETDGVIPPSQLTSASGAAASSVTKTTPQVSKIETTPTAPANTPVITSDIFQPKEEVLFQAKKQISDSNKPAPLSFDVKAGELAISQGRRKFLLPAGIGLVVILGAAASFFYIQSSGLKTQLDSQNQNMNTLNQQLSALTNDKSQLTAQASALNSVISDLSNQLSLFALPTASTTMQTATFKGVLASVTKSLYYLTTDRQIQIFIKNSRDTAVSAALKPLLGNQVEISGTYIPGSNYVTVTAINGQAVGIQLQQATSTKPASTSTAPTSPVAPAAPIIPPAATTTPTTP